MKKIKQLSLNKQTIARLQSEELLSLIGKGLYYTDVFIGSIGTTQNTQLMSCCDGGSNDCARASCHPQAC